MFVPLRATIIPLFSQTGKTQYLDVFIWRESSWMKEELVIVSLNNYNQSVLPNSQNPLLQIGNPAASIQVQGSICLENELVLVSLKTTITSLIFQTVKTIIVKSAVIQVQEIGGKGAKRRNSDTAFLLFFFF